jgi:hypothetical protein
MAMGGLIRFQDLFPSCARLTGDSYIVFFFLSRGLATEYGGDRYFP